ncbi:hypothetical protein [Streptacidiphilus carbonis]|uniref:hypothetical protein n=1 Tax=Streptacidiphilus carbonis TaxID=105422 RepID=UPI0005AB7C5F|nr:hypothetical protein [Streptacidiphilus carbonis]
MTGPAGRRRAPGALWTWLCALTLAALTAALARTFTSGATLGRLGSLHHWYLADGALFALAVFLLRRVPPRRTAALVLAGAVAVALTGLLAPPRTSDDAYRYLWDGQVQAAGISPYTYAPTAPALAPLRAADPALFPVTGGCRGWDLHRAGPVCTHLNRPTVHTIYPPVAQVWFLGLYEAGRLTGGHGVRTAQVGGAALAVLTSAALLLVLRRNRAPLHRAALWAWCPGVAMWAVNDAHVDTLGVLLSVCGLAAAASATSAPAAASAAAASAVYGRRVRAGVLLGAAVAAKLIPALVLPGALAGVLRRRPSWRDTVVPAVAALTFLLCYLPYVLASGPAVLGYLPGYLKEEGYDQGTRFALLGPLGDALGLEQRQLSAVVAAVLLAAVLLVLRNGDPARPWRGALTVFGTALFLAAPGYPWYALLVVGLVALDGRWEWLALPAAAEVMVVLGAGLQRQAYAGALCVVLAGTALRVLARTGETVLAVSAPAVPRPAPRPVPAAPAAAAIPIRTGSSR